MVDWTLAGLLLGYFGIAGIALYLQHKAHQAAMERMADLHREHMADLTVTVSVLRTALESAQREVSHLRGELVIPP